MRLQRLAGTQGCVAIPQLIDQAVDGDRGRVGGDEHGEQPSFLGPRHREKRAPIVANLQRPKDAALHDSG